MAIAPLFADLRSPELVLGWGVIDRLQGTADPAEWKDIQHAAAARQKEFIAGRSLVRQLGYSLGLPDAPVRRAKDRSPRWPTDRLGSLSHCTTVCAGAVSKYNATQSIGIDIESIGRVETKLWPTLFTAGERHYLDRLEPTVARLEATIFFSAKESFYKCQYPLTQSWVGFQDVELERLEDKLLRISPTTSAIKPWHKSPIYVDSVDEQHIATLTLFHG